MANTFNNYYLNEAGLATLIKKIKANDDKLAALLGFDDWTNIDPTDNFQSIVDRLKALEDADITDQIKDILGYTDPSWPTDPETGDKLSVQERFTNLIDEIIGYDHPSWPTNSNGDNLSVQERFTNLANDITEADSMASAAFNEVEVAQDNDNQLITLTFTKGNGDSVSHTIDTTDFIVHGILNNVEQVELNGSNVEAVQGVIKYKRGQDDYLTLPDKVLRELAGLDPDADVSGIGVSDINAGLPATYLLMSFGTHPDPNDSSIHDDEEPVWVNLSSMFKQYTFNASNPDLVDVTEANGTVTVAPGEKLEDLVSVFTDSETGEIVIPDFPAVALGQPEVDYVWVNGTL